MHLWPFFVSYSPEKSRCKVGKIKQNIPSTASALSWQERIIYYLCKMLVIIKVTFWK